MASRAEQLRSLGQSVWLDFIRRGHLESGEFDRTVREQGVVGVTSNPTIFQQAFAAGADYDRAIEQGVAKGLTSAAMFDAIQFEDIQAACDHLRSTFDATGGLDGRVSIEVNPKLAHDTSGTIEEARRLHRLVARPNVMVKVPATAAGIPAIATLIGEGMCINITLIFSLDRYAEVIEAYLRGLETRASAGQPLDAIVSVASFFVSRVDAKVDAAIDAAVATMPAGDPRRAELETFRGRAAIANARLAYQRFQSAFAAPRFGSLRTRGARVQRPLWASTSTKNPKYPDTYYVDELIGADTVNTMPPQTLAAFNDHGTVAITIDRDLDEARRLFARLPELGVPLGEKIAELEPEGVAAFEKSYDSLIQTLEQRCREMAGKR